MCTRGNWTVPSVRTPEYEAALVLNWFQVNNSKWTEDISVTTFAQLHLLWYINQEDLSVLLTMAVYNDQLGGATGKPCPCHRLLIQPVPAESGIAAQWTAPGKATNPSCCFFLLQGQISAVLGSTAFPDNFLPPSLPTSKSAIHHKTVTLWKLSHASIKTKYLLINNW